MKVVSIWIDAAGFEQISPERTPFLYSLSRKYGLGVHLPVFGFTSIGAAFYTGRAPFETDQFCLFWKKKKRSGELLSFLPPFLATTFLNLQRVLMGRTFLVRVPDSRILKNFSPAQDFYYNHHQCFGVKTLLNILEEKKLRYIDYNWPYVVKNGKLSYEIFSRKDDSSNVSCFLDLARGKDYQFYFLHLYELDKIGHQFGPNSREYREHLKKVDLLVRKIFTTLVTPEDKFLIWSDHGMVEVKKTIDLPSILPPQKDYQYLLESTMARFWFDNQVIKNKVLKVLKKIAEGRLLSAADKQRLGVNFSHRRYGDEIFLVKPGMLIFPNIFQRQPIKGMHGYDPRLKLGWGFFITSLPTNAKYLGTQNLFSLINSCLKVI